MTEEIPSLAYICAHCGCIAEVPMGSVGPLDSGTTLTCDECGEATVVDLCTPAQRKIDIWTEGDERDTWVDV